MMKLVMMEECGCVEVDGWLSGVLDLKGWARLAKQEKQKSSGGEEGKEAGKGYGWDEENEVRQQQV